MRIPAALLVPVVLAATCLGASAQQLKPGLWEINNKMKGNPQMEAQMAQMQKQLEAMPPEQRKQMEDMMAQRGMRMTPSSGGGMTMQICMTKEMVERKDVPVREGCTVTKQDRGGNSMKFAFTCSNPPSSGEGEFSYSGDQAYSSHMVVTTTVQGRSQTTEMDGAGKWLAADCGNIKPPVKKQ
jgi:hypothetical protein